MSVFEEIYQENKWRSDESVSGNGSTMDATAVIRAALPGLFEAFGVHSVLDIPCGDFNWFREVDGFNTYIGADIVPELIEHNRKKYTTPGKAIYFEVLDVGTSQLPKSDLVLVRDLFGHLPNAKIKQALGNIRRSRSRLLLTTTFPDHHNTDDIAEGDWRPVNMAEYWGLGDPFLLINEGCTIPGFEDKSLGLWTL